MTLESIIVAILTSTAVETLDQLTNLVEVDYRYRGKSKGKALKRKIVDIAKYSEEIQQLLKGSDSHIELKLGRFTGRIDLS
jgi:predicted glycosyltransferase